MVQGGLAHSGVVCHDLSWFGMVRSTWSDGVAVGNASRFFEVIFFSRASRSLAKTGFFLSPFLVFFSRFFSGGQKGVQRWSQASQMAPKSHPKSPKIMKK